MDTIETSLGVAGLFTDRVNRFLGNVADELKQALSHNLEIYTKNWYNRTSKVKTYIYREGSIDFYSIYFPLKLTKDRRKITIPEDIGKLFEESNYLTILGHAGSGKTMLMRHFFLSFLRTQTHIPVIVELRELNRYPGSFYEYIATFVFNMKLAANASILERLLDSGEFVFFLDGYDELDLDTKQDRTSQICQFVDRFPHNYYMMTSRPEASAESLVRFENYHICPLSPKQVKGFVSQQINLIPDGKNMEEKIQDAIDRSDEGISAYLANPLLLSMFILTFGYHPTIPSKKTEFYFNVFDTLFTKHDTITKGGGFTHDRACKLERYQYVDVLKWFSYRTYFKQNYQFSRQLLDSELTDIRQRLGLSYNNDNMIYDLTVAISILLQDGLDYIFPHRSMQEYFAAQLIMSLPEEIRVRKVYDNRVFMTSNNQNLWSLCMEVNEYEFKKNFISRTLNSVVSNIEKGIKRHKNKPVALVEYLVKKSNLTITYSSRGTINCVSHMPVDYPNLIMFLGYPYELVRYLVDWCFLNGEKLTKIFDQSNLDTDVYPKEIRLADHISSFLPLIIEEGLDQSLFEKYEGICKVVTDLNTTLGNWSSNSEKLLDI